jgi:hypothetical protein
MSKKKKEGELSYKEEVERDKRRARERLDQVIEVSNRNDCDEVVVAAVYLLLNDFIKKADEFLKYWRKAAAWGVASRTGSWEEAKAYLEELERNQVNHNTEI